MADNNWGANLNPGEYRKLMQRYGNPYQDEMKGYNQQLQDITGRQDALLGDQFQWNYEDYLPGIQNMANAIYDPQQAQLQALRDMGQISYEQQTIETMEQFDKRMQQEVEAINRRGAYFSGGAIQNEQDIRTEQSRAMNQQALQYMASDYGMQTQQAMLDVQKTQFIQDELINNETSAYNRWFNERGFQWGALSDMRDDIQQDKQFRQNVFESDRADARSTEQFRLNYDLNEREYNLAKEKYKEDKRRYGEDAAWQKFKYFDSKKKSGSKKKSDGEKFFLEVMDNVAYGKYENPYDAINSAQYLAEQYGYGDDIVNLFKDAESSIGEWESGMKYQDSTL
jgi:hypothetical protein